MDWMNVDAGDGGTIPEVGQVGRAGGGLCRRRGTWMTATHRARGSWVSSVRGATSHASIWGLKAPPSLGVFRREVREQTDGGEVRSGGLADLASSSLLRKCCFFTKKTFQQCHWSKATAGFCYTKQWAGNKNRLYASTQTPRVEEVEEVLEVLEEEEEAVNSQKKKNPETL